MAALRLASVLVPALVVAALHSVSLNVPGGYIFLKGTVSAVTISGSVCGINLYPGQRLIIKLWTHSGYVEATEDKLVVKNATGEALVDGRLVCRGVVEARARVKPGTLHASLALTARPSSRALVAVDAKPLEADGKILVSGITSPFTIDLDAGRARLLAETVAVNPSHLLMVASEGVLLAALLAAPISAAMLLTLRRRDNKRHKGGVL